ncbi:uncharacterized protein [Littorina saxatilis]|uniref:uncharacterized protein n=1 Tax=Littorina saxatilis TaxID=31220 RepID=UPI0038B4528F
MVAEVLTNGKETTCTMQSVKQGDKASLKCDFGEDLTKSRHGIYIQRYVGNSSEPEHVMDCYWPKASDNYKCTPSSPFVFSGNISHSLTLDLPSAQSSDEGTYYCEVVENNFSFQFCNFTTHSANGSREDAQIDKSSDTTTAATFDGSIDTNTTAGTLRKGE